MHVILEKHDLASYLAFLYTVGNSNYFCYDAQALVWTKRAIQGYDKIVRYLERHWTDKEVRNFINESDEFFTLLSQYPELFKKTSRQAEAFEIGLSLSISRTGRKN